MKSVIFLLLLVPYMLLSQLLIESDGGIKISNFPNENIETTDEGVIRFNSKNKDFEGWNGTNWISLTMGLKRGSVKDIDGNEYETIHIGDQEWMAENLYAIHFRNGEVMPIKLNSNDWIGLATTGISFVDNNSGNSVDYGILYNWYATVDPRGVCPIGWKIPTQTQWEGLRDFLGGSNLAFIKTKEEGLTHWAFKPPTTGLENASGFNGRGAGSRNGTTGNYQSFQITSPWWSTTESLTKINGAIAARLFTGSNIFQITSFDKRQGVPLRCIKM